MEWDCRIACDKRGLRIHSLVLYIFVILVTNVASPAGSLHVDCDATRKVALAAMEKCGCLNSDGIGEIDCPIFSDGPAPVNLKVLENANPGEAILRVTCAYNSDEFKWKLIHGVDLAYEKIGATITKVEMQYCPLVDDGLQGFFSRVNITAKQLTKFTFNSKPRSVPIIPASFLTDMTNLEALNLNQNNLEQIPDLSHLTKLKTINLRDNKIESIPVELFKENKNLEIVALSKNAIFQIEPKTFPVSVKLLELASNNISKLNNESFMGLKNLERLILDRNPLDKLEPNCFDNLVELKELYLIQSRFKTFPSLQNLPKLSNISIKFLNYGKKTEPLSGPVVLKNLPALEFFEAVQSKLTTLPEVSFLPKLFKMDLSKNQIKILFKEFFRELPSLKLINLSENNITDLPEIISPRLEVLNLNENKIFSISKVAFRHLGKLQDLKLHKNMIQNVDFHAFESLAGLTDLDMSYNNISFSNNPYVGLSLSPDILGGDPSMTSPLKDCPRLKNVNLSHNAIDKIYEDWTFLSFLTFLDLSYNKIKHVQAADFNFISNQKLAINISSNEISHINLDNYWIWLQTSSSNVDIYINDNPLDCSCSAFLIKNFTLDSHRLHFNKLRCSGPEDLKGMRLIDVPDKNLQCPLDVENGCPQGKCDCKIRPADETIIIDCSNRRLIKDEIPYSDWKFSKGYNQWSLELNFSTNEITDIDNNYISNLPDRVKSVDISGNNLSSISFLTSEKKNAKMNFSLMNNPFPCDSCSDFVFLWATQSPRIIDNDNVTCLIRHGNDLSPSDKITVKNLSDLNEACQPVVTSEIRILIVVVAVLTAICIVLIFFLIRYAWVLKAFLYSKGWGWILFWDNDLDADDGEKLYDAFVSYSHKDEDWVVEELVNRLEEKEGFKLCLHFRDWTPGDWIPDQIVKSVDQSKRTVVILSKNFVESVWSRLEFKAAHAQALNERSNRVILILIEDDLKDKDVQDDDLRVYMKMNTYLKWNDPWFWHKLKYALPHRKAQTDEDENVLKKMHQRERAINLDKLRAKLEQTV